MPSRPKRKKAVKKKKDTSHSPPAVLLQGNDDLRFPVEGQIVAGEGEISSHTHQINQKKHSLIKEEEVKDTVFAEDPSNYSHMEESSNGKLENNMKVNPEGEDVEVAIEESKPDHESFREKVSEFMDKIHDGDDSSSSSSSSDDESKPIENIPEVDSLVVEPAVNFSEESTQVQETPIEIQGDSNNGSIPTEVDSLVAEAESNEPLEKNNGSYAEVKEVVLEAIEETIFPTSDENSGEASGTATDLSSKEIPDNKKQADENPEESSGVEQNEETLLEKQTVVPSVETSNGNEANNESEIPESIGNKPVISMTPRTLHPTSWRGCCGLFDVLKRSNR